MIWVGIGLIVIGIAFFALVILLVKPLNKLASVLGSLQKTTDELPKITTNVVTQATDAMGTGVDVLNQVNSQVKELSPLFYIVGDVGRATNQLSHSMVDAVEDMKEKTAIAEDFTSRRNLEGLYGALTLGYFIFQQAKGMQK